MKPTKRFLTFIILLLVIGYTLLASLAFAEGYTLNVPIPGFPAGEVTGLGQFIKAIYNWGLGMVGLVAFAMIVWGAIEYTVSAGNASRRQDAVDRITQAIVGLTLLLGAYIILYTIDPGLVTLKEPGGMQLEEVQAPELTVPYEISPQITGNIESIKTKAAEAIGKIQSARNRALILYEEASELISDAVVANILPPGTGAYEELNNLELAARAIGVNQIPPLIAQAEAKRDEVDQFANNALLRHQQNIDALNQGLNIPPGATNQMNQYRAVAEERLVQLIQLQNQIEELSKQVESIKTQIEIKIVGHQ